jgi:hypothetical protein
MALTNALAQEDIKAALAELGFTEARLNEGLALYQAADTLYQKQKREYTDQYLASEALQQAWDEAQIAFRKYATAAKLALMEQATLKNSIGLHSGRKFTLPEWITLTRTFYGTALQSPAILERFAVYAVTVEKLQAGLQLVDKVEELKGKREIEKAEAQQVTRDRDEAFAQLDRYMYQFTKVARVVLDDKPKHLEKIGILFRTAPPRKKKENNGTNDDSKPTPEKKAVGTVKANQTETAAGQEENLLLEKI